MNEDLRFPSATKLSGPGALPASDLQKPLGGIDFPRTALSHTRGFAAFEEFVAAHKEAPVWDRRHHLDDPRGGRLFRSKCLDDPLWAAPSHCVDDPMFRRSALDGRLLYRSAAEDRRLWSHVDDSALDRRLLAHF